MDTNNTETPINVVSSGNTDVSVGSSSISGVITVNDEYSVSGDVITITMNNILITSTSCIIVNTNKTNYPATGFITSEGEAKIQVSSTGANTDFNLHFVIIHF